jgi:hypothetical protein
LTGVEILKGLLSGGAHVVITTSRYNRTTVEYYQSIYQAVGSRALTVVPFNQGSKQDVEALVDYIYATFYLFTMPGHPFLDSSVLTNFARSYLRRADFLMVLVKHFIYLQCLHSRRFPDWQTLHMRKDL